MARKGLAVGLLPIHMFFAKSHKKKGCGGELVFKYEVETGKKSLYTFTLILPEDGLVQSNLYSLVRCI